MNLPSTREIILRLKEVKAEKKLSVPRIQRMCEEAGYYMAINTFRNVFAKGSENDSFSYEYTIRPIAGVLLPADDPEDEDVVKELEILTEKIKRDREEYNKRIEYLNHRIKAFQVKVEEQEKLIRELLVKLNGQETEI